MRTRRQVKKKSNYYSVLHYVHGLERFQKKMYNITPLAKLSEKAN